MHIHSKWSGQHFGRFSYILECISPNLKIHIFWDSVVKGSFEEKGSLGGQNSLASYCDD